jgi:hypothetical protein
LKSVTTIKAIMNEQKKPRGGKRPGAGRPAAEPTKTCRVPLGALPLIEQYRSGAEFVNSNQTEIEALRTELAAAQSIIAVLEKQQAADKADYLARIKQLETANKSLSTQLKNAEAASARRRANPN